MDSKCKYDLCDGGGLFFDEEDGREVGVICKCRKDKIIDKRLKFAAIPREFAGLTIDDFKTKEVYNNGDSVKKATIGKRAVSGYFQKYKQMREKGKGLYLYSNFKGSGKTRIAVSLGNDLIHSHKCTARFTTTSDLLSAIRSTYKPASNFDTHELIDAVKEVELLILDDIGQDRMKADTNEHLYSILNHRMVNNKPTIFTSNCKIEELDYDERIIDRIMAMAIPVHMPEESARRNIAKKDNNDLLKGLLID